MKMIPIKRKTLALLVVMLPMLSLFLYVALRSGPLAPVQVTVKRVENRALAPALFGIGTVETQFTYKVGPTFAGRIKKLDVHVGDMVKAGQVLGEMDPVDLDELIIAQEAALKRVEAKLVEAEARFDYASTQARRYQQLLEVRSTSEEIVATKKHELQVAEANLNAAKEDLSRARAERKALIAKRHNLNLISKVDALVVKRDADPGTTVVAGQEVLELIDPDSIWINTRFDQIHARGLTSGLTSRITLRTQKNELPGRILRVEPLADAVTEEMLAKVVFDEIPNPLPRIGELVEITVDLPKLDPAPTIPNGSIRRQKDRLGVWRVVQGELQFAPILLGDSDLEGYVQVRKGLRVGDEIVLYSARALNDRTRIQIVESLVGED